MRTLGKLGPEIAHRLRQLHHRNHSRNLRALGRVVIDAFSSSHRLPYCSHSPGVRSHASHQKYKRFRRTRNLDRQPIPIKFARPSTFPADLDSAHSTLPTRLNLCLPNYPRRSTLDTRLRLRMTKSWSASKASAKNSVGR